MRTCLLSGIFLLILAGFAYGQATSEFNWIPSGNIDIGNLLSENDSNYRSVGDVISSELAYLDGTRSGEKNGRKSIEETFTVIIGRYRGGPCKGEMIIRRCIDTGTEPEELTITIDGKEVGKWTRPKFDGNRRLADVFYIVPRADLMGGDPNNPNMKWRLELKITSPTPYETYRYDFFITREWAMMPEGYTGAIAPRGGDTPADFYVNGLVKEGDHLWEEAKALYKSAADKSQDFEFARCARMRIRKCNYFLSASKVVDTGEQKNFDTHFLLGQYAASNGLWNEAFTEYTKAVEANTASGDATYNLGEAMQYLRMPVEKYSPVMGRAGWLYNRKDVNHVTAHVAINTYEIPGGPEGRMKAPMGTADMEASFANWKMIEQMVFGASRGAWKIDSIFEPYTKKDLPWIMHLGWLWGPPNESIPEWGMYDHTISHAAYGSSHCGGIDCGPAWSGCCQVGPGRGWEVVLHEWNHQFDWTAGVSENGRGYATTHDSDGCGKQPIVDMGTGHLASMRYYLRPMQYKRIEPSDANIPETHIKTWAVCGPFDAPVLKGVTSEEVLAELKAKGLATDSELKYIAEGAKGQNMSVAQFARQWFYNGGRMDLVKAVEDEAHFGPMAEEKTPWQLFVNESGGRVDLNALFPNAAPKSFAYANVYIFSPEDKEVRAWYGYHDSMRVWHNGRLVHEGRYYTTAYYDIPTWVDMMAGSLKLKKGWNSLLVKVERCGGYDYYGLGKAETWGFSVNLVNYDNTPAAELEYQSEIPEEEVHVYKQPDVGRHYRWDDVSEDYVDLLPQLTEEDFRKLTGISELTLVKNAFIVAIPKAKVQKGSNAITLEDIQNGIGNMTHDGVKVTPVNFLDLPIPGTPQGQEPSPFNKFKTQMYQDVTINNHLNLDREGAGALRYIEDGKPVDLLFIRPEYMDEYLNLIDDARTGMSGRTKDRILGYWFIKNAAYPTTGNRTWRIVIVAKTYLGENYPIDEQDILAVPAPPAK